MPKWDAQQRRIITARTGSRAPYRVCQWTPNREKWYVYRSTHRDIHIRWRPWTGYTVIGSGPVGSAYPEVIYLDPLKKVRLMKRRSVVSREGAILPALSAESKVLAKLPALREFLSATAYEDGTARTPGYFWFSNRRMLYEVILFDPDSGSRLPVTALTMDDVFVAAEALLTAPEAAWQPDKYLTEQLAKKTKRKGA